jgi:hypothetical protein
MTQPVTKAVVEAGIVGGDALAQLQRWLQPGLPLDVPDGGEPLVSAAAVAQKIMEAVESEEAVEIKATDLDIVRQYLSARRKARLHVPNPEDPGKTVGIQVEYCRTRLGEVVIPWTSESINDTLLDERTYLKPVGEDRIYFADVRELFYGDHKAFMVCEPAKEK